MALAGGIALVAVAAPSVVASDCPADLDGDRRVDGADLGILLAAWGRPGATDLDGNGTTDAADLGAMLAAWGGCPERSPTLFTGAVVFADGTPVEGAVVVTDHGGVATTDPEGVYELELVLATPVDCVNIAAIATIRLTTCQGSTTLERGAIGAANAIDPIVVEPHGQECVGFLDWLPGFEAPGMDFSVVSLAILDDGTGAALYAGGDFTTVGGVAANHIARWDGTTWSPLGRGLDGTVYALTIFDDGTGPALYAGGEFATAGGAAVGGIARWDGTSWNPVGGGMDNWVYSLAVFDDGTGPALYAGGWFTTAGGVAANRIAKWDGTTWSPLGGGVHGEDFPTVFALTVFDDGTGPALYAGGLFTDADGVDGTLNIARWDGTSWSPLGSGVETYVSILAVFDDGTGPALHVGGEPAAAGGVEASSVARWDGTTWSPLGSGMNDWVHTMTVFDDGTGPALYAGGRFTIESGVAANRIAQWTGTSWIPVGSGLDASVRALTAFDDGTGPALHAAGSFATAGGATVNGIARMDGASWRPLGRGQRWSRVGLTVWDDGAGPALFAGGVFSAHKPVVYTSRIARWDGASWVPREGGFYEIFFGCPVADEP